MKQKDSVVVPTEPTEEMLRAAAEESGMWCEPHEAERESGVEVEQSITPEDAAAINEHTYDMLRSQYKAMLAASPSHPQEKDAGRCKHGVRWPHPCRECEDGSLMAALLDARSVIAGVYPDALVLGRIDRAIKEGEGR